MNLNWNLSSVSSPADLNFPSVLSTVWGMSSLLIQVTCVPALTVTTPGLKTKLSILTSISGPVGAPAEGGWAGPEPPPDCDAEDANVPPSAISDTTVTSAIALHLRSTTLLILILFILHLLWTGLTGNSRLSDFLFPRQRNSGHNPLAGTFFGSGRCRAIERRIHNCETLATDQVVHIRDPRDFLQWVGRPLHRPRRRSRTRRRLREGRRHRRVEGKLAFDLLHHLVDVAVEHSDGTELLHVRQGLLTVVGSPAPIWVDGPQRNVREEHNRSTGRAPLQIVFQPLQLLVTERSQAASFQVDDIHQADEMDALLVEAVPPRALCALAIALEILFAVVGEHVMFTGHEVDLFRGGSL